MPDRPVPAGAPGTPDVEPDIEPGGPTDPAWDALLARALAGAVGIVYQPIVDLRRGCVVGYEALARFGGTGGPTPDCWFAAAELRGLGPDLDAVVLRRALDHRADLPPDCFLTVNLAPTSLGHAAIETVLAEPDDLGGVIVELTEQQPIDSYTALEPALDRLRAAGAALAVDDAGAAYAGLQHVLELRPAILKLDRSLVTGIDHDEAKVALVEMLGVFAARIDARLLAEGIERLEEAHRIRQLRVPLAQGNLFARPAPPWATLEPAVRGELAVPETAADHDSLRGLLEVVPWVGVADADLAGRHRGASGHLDHVVVLDDRRRPVGMLDPADALGGTLTTPLRADVGTHPADLARRVATRAPSTRFAPVVVCDDAGRYVGVVRIERLLAALADALPR